MIARQPLSARHLQNVFNGPSSSSSIPQTVAKRPRRSTCLNWLSRDGVISRDIQSSSHCHSHVADGPELNAALGQAIQKLEEFWRQRPQRIAVLKSLSNPFRFEHNARPAGEQASIRLPEANAGPVSHEVFKARLASSNNTKTVKAILRTQLLHCEEPADIYRVVAVALKSPRIAECFSELPEPLIRALYRCRRNVDDRRVLRTILAILGRMRLNGVAVDRTLYHIALRFAARARDLGNMKRVLQICRQVDIPLNSNAVRSVVAKFSIGVRGLGEIRNGRWKKADLLQILTGFPDCAHLPLQEQFHFGAFVDRTDWSSLHGYIAALARCRDVSSIWEEWQRWKVCATRLQPRRLQRMDGMNTRTRGDRWFVSQMSLAGGISEAWTIFKEAGLSFEDLSGFLQSRLLETPEMAPDLHTAAMRRAMMDNLDERLQMMEATLGVKWIKTTPTATGSDDSEGISSGGHHVRIVEQEEVLEKLSSSSWSLDPPDYGFAYDENQSIGGVEQELHEALPTSLFGTDRDNGR